MSKEKSQQKEESYKKYGFEQEENINAKITIDCTGRNYVVRKTMPEGKFHLFS